MDRHACIPIRQMSAPSEELPLGIPETPEAIEEIQRRRKPVAFENAKRAKFWKGKLDHIDPAKLDDPEEWAKIPILDKDQLRRLSTEEFYEDFCTARHEDICEYWRSGGSTGMTLSIIHSGRFPLSSRASTILRRLESFRRFASERVSASS